MGEADLLVVGSGLNGLVTACLLARRGFRVTVLESDPKRPGGSLTSLELTRPGFFHDLTALPLFEGPAFRELTLERTGLRLVQAPFDACHLASDGTHAALSSDPERATAHFATDHDARTWRALRRLHGRLIEPLERTLLGPLPALGALFELGPFDGLRVLRTALGGIDAWSHRTFRSEAARRVFPGIAWHYGCLFQGFSGALLGWFLAAQGTTRGFPFPSGGARAVTNALVTDLEAHGGQLLLGASSASLVTSEGRVRAVRLRDGREIPARLGVVLTREPEDVADRLPSGAPRPLERRAPVSGFRVDFALSGAVPWACATAHQSALVFTGDPRSKGSASRTARPDAPCLVVSQPSLFDPTRAPPHHQTLTVFAAGSDLLAEPSERLATPAAERFADRLEEHLEGLAPGFRDRVLARRVAVAAPPPSPPSATLDLPSESRPSSSMALEHARRAPRSAPPGNLYVCAPDRSADALLFGMAGYRTARRIARDLA